VSAPIVPPYVRHRAQSLAAEDNPVTLRAKAIAQNGRVRANKGSVDRIDGFPDQIKRGTK
jgi:hypothetical protein